MPNHDQLKTESSSHPLQLRDYRVLFYLAVTLISYGSLFPFEFVSFIDADAWQRFLSNNRFLDSRADALGNIALFVPFGFFFLLSSAVGKGTHWGRIVAAFCIGIVFAFALQIAQIYIPSRTAALGDVAWNTIGNMLGIILGYSIQRRNVMHASDRQGLSWNYWALVMLWLISELIPFVPTLDWQEIKDSLKPLLFTPSIESDLLVYHIASVIGLGEVLSEIVGVRHTRRFLPLIVVACAAAKVFVVTLALDLSTVAGFGIGYAVWALYSLATNWRRRNLVFWSILGAVTLGTFVPFTSFSGEPTHFNWIPFATMLHGSMLDNVRILTQTLFLYGMLLWLPSLARSRLVPLAVGLSGWIAMLELAQVIQGGHTVDVTEPMLVFMMLPFVAALQPVSISARSTEKSSVPASTVIPAFVRDSESTSPTRVVITTGAFVLLITLSIREVLSIPGIPYNLNNLFNGGAAFPFVAIFALAILSIGAGAAWVGLSLSRSTLPYLTAPAFVTLSSLVTLLLLSASVTQESLDDIAGANNLYWFVIHKNIWGDWGHWLFQTLDSPQIVGFFERLVRFTALFGPLILGMGLMIAVHLLYQTGRATGGKIVVLIISTLPWFWLCKAIAFDWSSTDNLNELIASEGALGMGGGFFLYSLLFLICLQAAFLARLSGCFKLALLGTLVIVIGIPFGWWLLNLGLIQDLHKYDKIYSGVQFLLGPDRSHTLTSSALFTRWAIVQFSAVIMLAAGAYLILLFNKTQKFQ